ncbi:MAG: patatin family protein, partial [Clostridia bacterium]|nr:patatin family protein [Clostridia bacterium]
LPLIKMKYRHYPKLVEAVSKRHVLYNETLAYIEAKEKAGQLMVIRPEVPLPVKRVEKDPKKLRVAYEIGKRTTEDQIDRIRSSFPVNQR